MDIERTPKTVMSETDKTKCRTAWETEGGVEIIGRQKRARNLRSERKETEIDVRIQ